MGHASWLLQYLTSGVRQSRFYPDLLLFRSVPRTDFGPMFIFWRRTIGYYDVGKRFCVEQATFDGNIIQLQNQR